MSKWLIATLIVWLSGCANVGPAGPYGARWHTDAPLAQRLREAARDAAVQPGTWLPLAGAAVLSIGSLDEDLADWAVRETPLFGSKAGQRSDALRSFTTASYFVTALLAPAERMPDRLGGIAVGVASMMVEGGVSEAMKSLSSRERPNGRGDRSFPSGHASKASSRSVLTLRNLRHYQLAQWQRRALQFGYLGVAGATGWARVEAEKHYPTDVLVGFALGQFLSNFAVNLFMRNGPDGLGFGVAPTPGGALLTLSLPLP